MQLNKTMMVSLLISAGLLSGGAFALSPTPNPTTIPSAPAWNSASTYTAGQRVTQNGTTYEAQWWTKGDSPATAGEWGAWKKVTVVATPTPIPTPTSTPSSIVTEPLNQARGSTSGSCTINGGAFTGTIWQANQQYAAGAVVSNGGFTSNGGRLVFRAAAAHLSSDNNKPFVSADGTTITYDKNLWQPLNWFVAPCPPPTPTPTAIPTPTATATTTPTATPTISATPTATPTATPVTTVAPTGDAWNSNTVYTAGKRATYNGRLYEAKWYTVGENPSTSGAWGVWKDLGLISSSTPTPTATATAKPSATPTASTTPSVSPSPTPTITASPTPSTPPAVITGMRVTTWKDDATAAYSMMHDDLCAWVTDGQIDFAAPALKQRGLISSFGMITGNCGDKHWNAAKQFIADGHEIFSHTRSHTDAMSLTWDAAAQISGSSDDIAARLNGYRPTFFAWPSGVAADEPLAFLRSAAGFIGGRAPNRVDPNGMIIYDGHISGVNATTTADPFQIKDDMFTLTAQWSLYEAQVKAGGDLLNLHVDAAIANGGWANRTMHGVNDASWNSVPLAQYTAHLDYIKAKVDARLLWVAGPSTVLKYSKAREACKPTLGLSNYNYGSVITFASTDAECVKFATPLTLMIGGLTQVAMQAGKAIPRLPSKVIYSNGLPVPQAPSFLITVDPLAGPVTFSAQ